MIKKDIRGIEPVIGSSISFNPPYFKGLVTAEVVGFTKSGSILIGKCTPSNSAIEREVRFKGHYTLRTNFVVL